MLGHLKVVLLVNLYWFSLPIIGYGLLLALRKFATRTRPPLRSAVEFALDQPLLGRIFMGFCLAVSLIAVVSIPAYALHWPPVLMAVGYVVLLLAGGGYALWLLLKQLFVTKDLNLFQLKGESLLTKLVFTVLLVTLAGDFALCLFIGADMLLGADTYFHLARIVSILAQGFNTQNGFYNVPENAYNYNVIYSLYVIPSYLTHIFPAAIWDASLAFFRFMQWAAIFTLAWHVCKHWLRDKLGAMLFASAATIFAIVALSAHFFVANYPDHVVFLWVVLLVLGLSFYEIDKKKSILPTVAAAVLLGMTHATYSLMAAMLIGLITVFKFVFERTTLTKRTLLLYGSLLVLLLLAPIRTALYPNKLSKYQFYNLGSFPIGHIFGWDIQQPFNDWHFLPILLLALGAGGMLYLLYMVWAGKKWRGLVLGLISFYPLIVYDPPALKILHARLPYWVLMVFSNLNVLCLISVPVGIYALCKGGMHLASRWKTGEPSKLQQRVASGALVVFILVLAGSLQTIQDIPQLQLRAENRADYMLAKKTYDSMQGKIPPGDTAVTDGVFGYFLPGVLPIKVIAIEEGHSSPLADYADRLACRQHLLSTFNYADLQAISARYVILGRYDLGYEQQLAAISTKSYLQKVDDIGPIVVYKLLPGLAGNDVAMPFHACVAYPKAEASL
ncbi:MAG TPA: hypothetical protein VLE99_00760 [Candidatus Saccharimonadales bacterium]|nr:hypothetical protein [Candidatus Saccharimonadales bacterium]